MHTKYQTPFRQKKTGEWRAEERRVIASLCQEPVWFTGFAWIFVRSKSTTGLFGRVFELRGGLRARNTRPHEALPLLS